VLSTAFRLAPFVMAVDSSRDPLFRNAVRAMSWSSASTAINTLIGLAGFFLLVRLLGPTNYGIVAMFDPAEKA